MTSSLVTGRARRLTLLAATRTAHPDLGAAQRRVLRFLSAVLRSRQTARRPLRDAPTVMRVLSAMPGAVRRTRRWR
jgi:hypothetical protein